MENQRIGEVLGVWCLDRLVGSGGMGDVYQAHRMDGVVRQTRAIKVLRAIHKDGNRDEADTLRPLDHPNIAKCFDSGVTEDGHRYLVMEFVEGLPITDFADQMGLSIHDRLELFLGACAAVEYSHQRLVVHLDLKPGNILVNQAGIVKVVDFGIARRLEGDAIAEPADAFSGPYASPEQIQPGSKLGFQTDIYALGAVLYELLCGHEPFDPHLAAGELERQILEEIPRAPSCALSQAKLKQSQTGKHYRLEPDMIARLRGCHRVSEVHKLIAGDLDSICLFALRKQYGRRYRSVEDLISDLATALKGRTPAIARSGDPLHTVLRAARRKPLAVIAALAAITAVPSGLGFFAEFSTARNGTIESTRQFNEASEPALMELRGQLRPKLAQDPDVGTSLEAIDSVLRAAGGIPPPRTLAQDVSDDFVLQLRQIIGTIPKNDLPDVP